MLLLLLTKVKLNDLVCLLVAPVRDIYIYIGPWYIALVFFKYMVFATFSIE